MKKQLSNNRQTQRILMILLIIAVMAAVSLNTDRRAPTGNARPEPTPYPTDDWITTTSPSFGYEFRHPRIVDGPAVVRDKLVEMYEEVDGLLILINDVPESDEPEEWIAGQKKEAYSGKPYSCFSRAWVTDIPSMYSPGQTILHFTHPVLFLDNIESRQGQTWMCDGIPRVRVIMIPHTDYILRITYRKNPLSEAMLSTFRFISPQ